MSRSRLLNEEKLQHIGSLAKNGAIDELKALFETGTSVAHRVGDWTPVKCLAAAKDEFAVWLLINTFHASIHDAVEGYAIAGWADKVEKMLELGASIDFAATGYAHSGFHQEVQQLLAMGASPGSAAYGYARTGQLDHAKSLITWVHERIHQQSQLSLFIKKSILSYNFDMERGVHIGPPDIDDDIDFIQCDHDAVSQDELTAIKQIGMKIAILLEEVKVIGHHIIFGLAIENRLSQFKDYIDYDYYSDRDVIKGYAYSGRINAIYHLIESVPAGWGHLALEEMKECAAHYCIYAGYDAEAEQFCKTFTDQEYMMDAYAAAGRVDKVDDLLNKLVKAKHSAAGYAKAELIEKVNELATPDEFEFIALNYHSRKYFDNQQSCLRVLALTTNQELQQYLAYNHDPYNMLTKATHMQRIMRDYQLSYDQARTLQEPALRIWLLLACNMQPKLPIEMILMIATHVAYASHNDMKHIHKAVCKNTLEGARVRLQRKYAPGLFGYVMNYFIASNQDFGRELTNLESHYDVGTRSKRVAL
jgi:pentatricopeptide repeat protein